MVGKYALFCKLLIARRWQFCLPVALAFMPAPSLCSRPRLRLRGLSSLLCFLSAQHGCALCPHDRCDFVSPNGVCGVRKPSFFVWRRLLAVLETAFWGAASSNCVSSFVALAQVAPARCRLSSYRWLLCHRCCVLFASRTILGRASFRARKDLNSA